MLAVLEDKLHEAVCVSIEKYLEKLGYNTYNNSFHLTEMSNQVKHKSDFTSLYWRCRSDRLSTNDKVSFEWDVKTNTGKYESAAIELFPLLTHIQLAHLGVKMCYVYCDMKNKLLVGFWADKLPSIKRIYLTKRFNIENYKRFAERFFPEAEVNIRGNTMGSEDPYACIEYEDLLKCAHYTDLFKELDVTQPS